MVKLEHIFGDTKSRLGKVGPDPKIRPEISDP